MHRHKSCQWSESWKRATRLLERVCRNLLIAANNRPTNTGVALARAAARLWRPLSLSCTHQRAPLVPSLTRERGYRMIDKSIKSAFPFPFRGSESPRRFFGLFSPLPRFLLYSRGGLPWQDDDRVPARGNHRHYVLRRGVMYRFGAMGPVRARARVVNATATEFLNAEVCNSRRIWELRSFLESGWFSATDRSLSISRGSCFMEDLAEFVGGWVNGCRWLSNCWHCFGLLSVIYVDVRTAKEFAGDFKLGRFSFISMWNCLYTIINEICNFLIHHRVINLSFLLI